MTDPSQRQAWTDGPGGDAPGDDAPPDSWLFLDDDALLQRIASLDSAADEDEHLLEIVTSHRHFFVRQEAAKRVKDGGASTPSRTTGTSGRSSFATCPRREDLTYLERISMLSRHVEIRQAAQVQLARVWRRLEQSQRGTSSRADAFPALPRPPRRPRPGRRPGGQAPSASRHPPPLADQRAGRGRRGDGACWIGPPTSSSSRPGTTWDEGDPGAPRQTRAELAPNHPALALFGVAEDARVTLDLESAPRLTRAAVRDVAMWMAAFRKAADRVAPGASADSVRTSTALMADALRAAGFYRALEDAEAALAL